MQAIVVIFWQLLSCSELQTKASQQSQDVPMTSQQIASQSGNKIEHLRDHFQKRKRVGGSNHGPWQHLTRVWDSPAEGQSTSLMLTPPGDTGVTLAAAAASATTRRPLRPRRPKPIASPALTEAGERPVVLVPPLARRRGGGRGACDAAARHCCTLARARAMPLQPMPGRLWHCSRAIRPQSPAPPLSLSLAPPFLSPPRTSAGI